MTEKPLKKKNLFYNLPWLCNVFLAGFMMLNVIPRLPNYFGWQCIPGLASIRDTMKVYVPIAISLAWINWFLAYRFKCKPFVAGAMALTLSFTAVVIAIAVAQ